jgi:WD40 repeat protein
MQLHTTKSNILLLIFPSDNIFLSGGSDKYIYGWHNKKRKKLFKTNKFPQPISHISLNSNSSVVAIASSWLCEDGNFECQNSTFDYNHSIFLIGYEELNSNFKEANQK